MIDNGYLSFRVKIIDIDNINIHELATSCWIRDKSATCEAVDMLNHHKSFDLKARFDNYNLFIEKNGIVLLCFKIEINNNDKLLRVHELINYRKGAGLRASIETALASDYTLNLFD